MIYRQQVVNDEHRLAMFSDDERYRYLLRIEWDSRLPTVVFIGLNPSTADEFKDDPTIRRCKRFARDWGAGSLTMLNLFAVRATLVTDMKKEPDPTGEMRTEDALLSSHYEKGPALRIVAAWGVHGRHLGRDAEFIKAVRAHEFTLHHLGLTQDGIPRHPLYLRADTKPEIYVDSRLPIVACSNGDVV